MKGGKTHHRGALFPTEVSDDIMRNVAWKGKESESSHMGRISKYDATVDSLIVIGSQNNFNFLILTWELLGKTMSNYFLTFMIIACDESFSVKNLLQKSS